MSNHDHRLWATFPSGYPRAAAFIAEDPDKTTNIHRRFERLATRNILYIESELIDLESKQDDLDRLIQKEEEFTLNGQNLASIKDIYDKELKSITTNSTSNVPADAAPKLTEVAKLCKRRLDLANRIRECLKEYNEALQLQKDILALNRPSKRTWKNMKNVFEGASEANPKPFLNYDPLHGYLNNKDLCVLAPEVERDRLSIFLQGPFAWAFRDGDYISHSRVAIVVSTVSTIAAAGFLIGAIFGLYYARNYPVAQLIMLSCFTVSFAGCLGLLTSVRRQDVYASTAAYTAVLVVFIGGNPATGPTASAPSSNSGNNNGTSSSSALPETSAVFDGPARVGVIVSLSIAAAVFYVTLISLWWRQRSRMKRRKSQEAVLLPELKIKEQAVQGIHEPERRLESPEGGGEGV